MEKRIKELEDKIKKQQEKVDSLNKFEKRMDFLDDEEIIEMYNVIHQEERILKILKEQLENLQTTTSSTKTETKL